MGSFGSPLEQQLQESVGVLSLRVHRLQGDRLVVQQRTQLVSTLLEGLADYIDEIIDQSQDLDRDHVLHRIRLIGRALSVLAVFDPANLNSHWVEPAGWPRHGRHEQDARDRSRSPRR